MASSSRSLEEWRGCCMSFLPSLSSSSGEKIRAKHTRPWTLHQHRLIYWWIMNKNTPINLWGEDIERERRKWLRKKTYHWHHQPQLVHIFPLHPGTPRVGVGLCHGVSFGFRERCRWGALRNRNLQDSAVKNGEDQYNSFHLRLICNICTSHFLFLSISRLVNYGGCCSFLLRPLKRTHFNLSSILSRDQN